MRFLLYVSLIDMSKGDLHVWRTWFFVFFETMDPWFQTDDAKAAHSELCENKKPGRTYCARFEIAEGFSERQLELFMISNEAIDDFLPSVCVLGHLRHQLRNSGPRLSSRSFQYCISCFLISTGLFLAFVSALQSTQLPSPAHLWFPPLPGNRALAQPCLPACPRSPQIPPHDKKINLLTRLQSSFSASRFASSPKITRSLVQNKSPLPKGVR